MDYYPSLLLIHARQVRGVSGLDADELREIAVEHWPSMGAEWIDQIVERAIEQRDAGQRRIDPKTVNVRHPRAREAEMATLTTGRLRSWLRERLEADPEIDNDTLEALANQEFGASNVSRRSLGQNAGVIRREMEAQPSTNGNGAKPEPSNEGGDQHAEAVDAPEAQGSGIAEPEQGPAPDAAPAGGPARDRLRKYARAYIAFSLVQDRDLDDPVRTAVRGEMYDLEEQLIGELTANVNHADVERRATELDQLADTLRQRTEGLLNVLAREGAVA